MSRKTIYNKNISAPAEITNEEYESVGASKFQLGDSRRFFLGANDFEIFTIPSSGIKLVEGVDYQLLDLDANLSTLCAKPVFSSLIILNAEYQNCKLYLNYRCVLSQLDAKQMNAMQLQIDANKTLNETQSAILTDHESRITANTIKNTEQDSLIVEIIATNTIQDEAHAAHVNNSEMHVTAADKARWDGKANTYLVDNIAARDALTGLNINDVVFVKDDGDGKRAGYYYNGAEASVLWEKFSDPDWENVSLEWSAVENVPQVLKDLADDGSGKLLYKGSAIGGEETPDWSNIENVPQVLKDFSDDGSGLKYKGEDIGTGGGSTPPVVDDSKLILDPYPYLNFFTQLTTTPSGTTKMCTAIGTDIYVVDYGVAPYNYGIYKYINGAGDPVLVREFKIDNVLTPIANIKGLGNDLYIFTPSAGTYKLVNGTGEPVLVHYASNNKFMTGCMAGDDIYLGNGTTGKVFKVVGNDLIEQFTATGVYISDMCYYNNNFYFISSTYNGIYSAAGVLLISLTSARKLFTRGDYLYALTASTTGTIISINPVAKTYELRATLQSNGTSVCTDSDGNLYTDVSNKINKLKAVKALNVFSFEEVETNTTWLGYKRYTKVIEIGALSNNGTKTVLHNIDTTNGITYKSHIITCKNPTNGYSFSPNNGTFTNYQPLCNYSMIPTGVVIYSGTDAQVYTKCFLTLEYIKANL